MELWPISYIVNNIPRDFRIRVISTAENDEFYEDEWAIVGSGISPLCVDPRSTVFFDINTLQNDEAALDGDLVTSSFKSRRIPRAALADGIMSFSVTSSVHMVPGFNSAQETTARPLDTVLATRAPPTLLGVRIPIHIEGRSETPVSASGRAVLAG